MRCSRSTALIPFLLAGVLLAARSAGAAEEVKVSHILVPTKEEAQKIRKEIVDGGGGKAFAAAARKYSRDAGSKVLGGSLDWVGPSSGYDKAFMDAAYGLAPGDISEPVQTNFGWHLLLVSDRRDRAKDAKAPKGDPPPPVDNKKAAPPVPPSQPPTPPTQNPPPVGPGQLSPTPPGIQPPAQPPTQTPTPTVTPIIPVEAKRRPIREDRLRMSIETVKTSDLSGLRQFTHMPEEAVEVNLTLKNEGPRDQICFVRELWPLGLRLSSIGDRTPIPGDFNALVEPASFFVTLKPYESIGIEVSLNDYFKKLEKRRYGLNWDPNLFLTNLEVKFPKVKELPDYATVSGALKKRFAVRTDTVFRDLSPRIVQQRGRDLPISIFENPDATKKYYVSLKLQGETQPVIIQLYMDKQLQGARQFANLVLEGFYDGLNFFEVEDGDFLIGGSPNMQITGGPNSQLPLARNDQKIEHKRGTVSLVSRSVRQKGPVTGGEIGSIFVICLKPHPEWNEEHVPVGEVTSGLEILDKVRRSAQFTEVTLLTDADLGAALAKAGSNTVGNPEALIKTSKGNITVELFEDVARNTVSNFVSLAETGFYNKDAKGGKQKLFGFLKNTGGSLIQTGSPTNDFDGGPGYYIADEPNPKKHVKGALAMVLQQDENAKLVPNSAGSQFFICLTDIPAYDFQERKFTVFGQVTGGLDVLDKLQEGDVLEGIEIPKKKDHPYTVNKIPTP